MSNAISSTMEPSAEEVEPERPLVDLCGPSQVTVEGEASLTNKEPSQSPSSNNNNKRPLLDIAASSSSPSNNQSPPKKPRKSRIVWRPLEVTDMVSGKTTFPFLEVGDTRDLVLVRHLLSDRPFEAGHGRVMQAWEELADEVSSEKDEDGNAVFHGGNVRVKTLQNRFLAMMTFVKKHEGTVPFRSGEDDEESPNELRKAIEDLYELYDSHKSLAASQKAETKNIQTQERLEADAIRLASIDPKSGNAKLREALLKTKTKPRTTPSRKIDDETLSSLSATPPTKAASLASSTAVDDLLTYTQKATDSERKRHEIRKEKLQQKRLLTEQKLKRREQEAELKRERFDLEKREREANMQVLTTTLSMMEKMMEKMDKAG